MDTLKAVIFDMDGVLIDSETAYRRVHEGFLASLGVEVAPEELDTLAGSSTKVERQLYAQWWERSHGTPIDFDEFDRLDNEFWRTHPIDYPAIMNPGVPETLARLQGLGYRLALASSSPKEHIVEVLELCSLTPYFEVVESGNELKQSKPNPEIYLLTLDKLGLPAEACCAVEDSDLGIEAARRAGIYVIAKYERRFGFTQQGANAVAKDIPSVVDAVQAYAAR